MDALPLQLGAIFVTVRSELRAQQRVRLLPRPLVFGLCKRQRRRWRWRRRRGRPTAGRGSGNALFGIRGCRGGVGSAAAVFLLGPQRRQHDGCWRGAGGLPTDDG